MSDKQRVHTTQTGLNPNTTYVARVRTFDKLGNPSGWTEATVFKTPELDGDSFIPEDNGPPGIPLGLSVRPGFKEILVDWNANLEEDMKYGFGNYIVEISAPSMATPFVTDTVQTQNTFLYYNDRNWDPGQDIEVRVRALDPYGNMSDWSPPVTVTTHAIRAGDIVPALVLGPGQSIQSMNWDGTTADDPDATEGWRIDADGDSQFQDAIIRGDIHADRFYTLDPAGGPMILMDTNEYGFASINFLLSEDFIDEEHLTFPAKLEYDYLDTPVSIHSLGLHSFAPPIPTHDFEAEPSFIGVIASPGNYSNAEVIGGLNTYISAREGSVNIAGPMYSSHPMRKMNRSSVQSISSGTTAVIITNNTLKHVRLSAGFNDDSVSLNATTGVITPKHAGLWEIKVRVNWTFPTTGEYGHQVGWRFNNSVDYWESNAMTNALAHSVQAPNNFSFTQEFNGTTDEFRLIGYHSRGSNANCDLREVTVELISS